MTDIRYGYIPTFDALDYIVPEDATEVVIYCDVKNGLYSMYYEESILAALKEVKATGSMNCGLISGLLNVIGAHKRWNKTRRDGRHTIKIVYFFESGRSQYHLGLNKDYKAGRKITDFTNKMVTQEDMTNFSALVKSNLDIFDKIANAIPDVYCVYLKYADADYVPHFFTRDLGLADDPKSFHIIYSNDKDMGQSLRPNVVQYIRRRLKKDEMRNGILLKAGIVDHVFLDDQNVNKFFWKLQGDNNFDVETTSMYLSLLGDVSDGIRGVHGIGGSAAEKIFTLLWDFGYSKLSTPEKFYDALNEVYSSMNEFDDEITIINEELIVAKETEATNIEKLQELKRSKEITKIRKEGVEFRKLKKLKIKELREQDKTKYPGKVGLINKMKLILDKRSVVELAWKQIDYGEIINHMPIAHKSRMHKVADKEYVDEITNLKELNLLVERTLSTNLYDK